MKANKIFAIALAALALVACKPDNNEVTALELSQTSATIKVGESLTLTANVTVDSWTSNKPEVATVADGVVTGVAEGTAIISATAGADTKTCVVKVEAENGGQGGSAAVKGSKFWPIIMDGETLEANQSKMVASFQPNDVDQFLYIWDNTYVAGNGDGLNSLGKAGFTALVVGSAGWSGCGFCLTDAGAGWQAAEALRKEIVAAPDNYYLHLAIKSTDDCSHCFYFLGVENGTKFVLGSTACYDGPLYQDFKRDGSWVEFDIPMANYANALATAEVKAGVNVFVALSENKPGSQLNLDAVYFYKK